ncbi:MAG: hypothetical protein LCH53_10490 [Bacteroidetes bacterium]|nr:hypothetical protein [Bacteroidota bacterium]
MRPLLLLLAAACVAGCDSEKPPFREDVVLEAFFDTGRPMPDVLVRRTLPPSETLGDDRVDDAVVVLYDGFRADTLRPVPGKAGRYRASPRSDTVRASGHYALTLRRGNTTVSASTVAPPRLQLTAARVFPSATPERGVNFDLTGLGLGATVANGYFYAVDVELEWAARLDSALVVRANLRPSTEVSGTLFFPADVVVAEAAAGDARGAHRLWRRRYLIAVSGPDAPLPRHRVRVALVRGGGDYRRFVETRRTPTQRSPTSNVVGGLGIVAGVSADSLTLDVE